ncbi:hypothetical protein PAXRUDRAFT_160273 [Paxillus rubicundulus Ve08.2h10]|uniref:Protein kinase domain-containing protein n=1 Tax=Paxillus rubicundulus Ve08.2h10 TaxID=930991 RepID=A0A0D0D7X4_9AGAM|nr:hypothetical protein PAXRUDRAFT_160273 [Paxillus rubicundulus Ve08.2h10]
MSISSHTSTQTIWKINPGFLEPSGTTPGRHHKGPHCRRRRKQGHCSKSHKTVGRIVLPPTIRPQIASHRSSSSKLPSDLTLHVFRQSVYPIAYGGWSDIWKCTLKQDSQSREVAIKSIRSHILDDDDMRKKSKKLRRELKVWARLEHENIIPLLGVATGFGPFTALVCPWMDSGTLSSYLEHNKEHLALRDRLELLRDAANGLCYLHSRSVVHGDLTGSNVLISASGRAQLADFGLSSIMVEFMGTSYLSSSMNGTARWAAPEIFTTSDDETSAWVPTERSDIYSFGSIMLQVYTGEVPYVNLQRDVQVLLALSRGVKPSRPATSWMNDRIWNFIQRCWLTEGHDARRPSAEEALNFIQGELSLL